MGMTNQELEALVAQLTAEKAELQAHLPKAPGITLKTSPKGALSIYGLGRFPVTLYKSQVERLLSDETVAKIRAFIVANQASLKDKVQA